MFIKNITFPEGHRFFNNGCSIEFGDTQRNLIDFYIKTTKKIKEGDKDAGFGNNIQINCILGDNGAGKSRFLREIYNYFRWGDSEQITGRLLSFSNHHGEVIKAFLGDGDAQYGPSWHQNLKDYKAGISPFSIILDDFFALSSNIEDSIHRNLLKSKGWNGFYCDTYNFFQEKETNKIIFSRFLGLKETCIPKLNLSLQERLLDGLLNDSTREEALKNLDEERYFDLFELLKKIFEGNEINGMSSLKNLLSQDKENAKNIWIYYSYIFLASIDKIWDSISFDDSFSKQGISKSVKTDEYKRFKESLGLFDFFLSLFSLDVIHELSNFTEEQYQSIYSDILTIKENLKLFRGCLDSMETDGEYSEEFLNKIQLFMHDSYSDRGINSGNFIDKLQKSKYATQDDSLWKNLLFNFSDPSSYDYSSEDKTLIKDVRRSRIAFLEALFDSHSSFIKKRNSYSIGTKVCLTPKEINIIANTIFSVDLGFYEASSFIKSFSSLSGGEKTMLARFATIYKEIAESDNGKKNFIILIDEPDLHLHLDWQRQYIQKLIDVFSTLPRNITLHFIIATHSPFIVSDLPGENIIRMRKDDNGTVIFQNYGEREKEKKNSFGANYIDIIQEGFFDNRLLMGSFAEEVITNLAIAEKIQLSKELLGNSYKSNELYREIENYMLEGMEKIKGAKNQIGDTFLKNYLLYFKTNENHTNSQDS